MFDCVEFMFCDINVVLCGKWLSGEDIGKLIFGVV